MKGKDSVKNAITIVSLLKFNGFSIMECYSVRRHGYKCVKYLKKITSRKLSGKRDVV